MLGVDKTAADGLWGAYIWTFHILFMCLKLQNASTFLEHKSNFTLSNIFSRMFQQY